MSFQKQKHSRPPGFISFVFVVVVFVVFVVVVFVVFVVVFLVGSV